MNLQRGNVDPDSVIVKKSDYYRFLVGIFPKVNGLIHVFIIVFKDPMECPGLIVPVGGAFLAMDFSYRGTE